MFWFGVVLSNAYYSMLEVAKPVDIFMVRSWFYAQQAMFSAHDGKLVLCDMRVNSRFDSSINNVVVRAQRTLREGNHGMG
ncbi:hypothetical protein [Enterobacter cloacae complex sp. 357B1]|uniref:hypothetical protein n=1 Tax=Enterobacter cloacae complex sp. 357B1 TaxID=3395827 RepID=UPI003CF3EDC6